MFRRNPRTNTPFVSSGPVWLNEVQQLFGRVRKGIAASAAQKRKVADVWYESIASSWGCSSQVRFSP
jgi:hypothetical protein